MGAVPPRSASRVAERFLETRFGRQAGELQGAILRTFEPVDQLPQMRLELEGHPPLHMPLEQQHETEAGQRQREQDRGAASDEQSQPQ